MVEDRVLVRKLKFPYKYIQNEKNNYIESKEPKAVHNLSKISAADESGL